MVVLNSFTQPTVGIRHRQDNTTVYVNDNNLGKGTLYIAESCLSWVSTSGNGFSIEYPHISLHAVSRDLSAFPQECLFLMLDTALGGEEASNGDREDDDEEMENGSSDEGTTELRLVPDDRGMLDAMYHAMNACQALHPDPEDSFSDEDMYEDADDELPVEEADSQMARLRIENMNGTSHRSRNGQRTMGMLNTSVKDNPLVTSAVKSTLNTLVSGIVNNASGTLEPAAVGNDLLVDGSAGRHGVGEGEVLNGSAGMYGFGQIEGLGNHVQVGRTWQAVDTCGFAEHSLEHLIGEEGRDSEVAVVGGGQMGRLVEHSLQDSLSDFEHRQIVGSLGPVGDEQVVDKVGDEHGNVQGEDYLSRFEDVEEEEEEEEGEN